METLRIHKKMFLNPKYKILGMLSVPYWTFFEFLAPIIVFTGIIITIIFIVLGMLNWYFFGLLTLFVYFFSVSFSVNALLCEELTFHRYPKVKDFLKLFVAALIEPFYFHPIATYSAIKGIAEKLIGKNAWGEMTRKGFKKE